MRKILYIFIATLVLIACSTKEEEKPDIAGQTALEYYNLLLKGKYDDFVAGMDKADSIPEDYRRQLVDNAAMYIGQMQKEHQGIKKIEKQASQLDEKNNSAEAFLTIYFADSTKEEVVVPMVAKNDVWYMK